MGNNLRLKSGCASGAEPKTSNIGTSGAPLAKNCGQSTPGAEVEALAGSTFKYIFRNDLGSGIFRRYQAMPLSEAIRRSNISAWVEPLRKYYYVQGMVDIANRLTGGRLHEEISKARLEENKNRQ